MSKRKKSRSVFISHSHSDADHVKLGTIKAYLDGFADQIRRTPLEGDKRQTIYIDGAVLANLQRQNKLLTSVALPTFLEIPLLLMSKARRDDTLNDMADWYPGLAQRHGRCVAAWICGWKVMAAMFGDLLDIAMRVGEVVGKFRGAK